MDDEMAAVADCFLGPRGEVANPAAFIEYFSNLSEKGKKTAMTAEKALKLADAGFIFDAKKGKRARASEGGGHGGVPLRLGVSAGNTLLREGAALNAEALLEAAGFQRVVDSGEWSDGTYEAMEKLKTDIISGNDVMSMYSEEFTGYKQTNALKRTGWKSKLDNN